MNPRQRFSKITGNQNRPAPVNPDDDPTLLANRLNEADKNRPPQIAPLSVGYSPEQARVIANSRFGGPGAVELPPMPAPLIIKKKKQLS